MFIRDVYEILRSNLHFIYICHDRLLQLVTELFFSVMDVSSSFIFFSLVNVFMMTFYDVLRSNLLFKYICHDRQSELTYFTGGRGYDHCYEPEAEVGPELPDK